MHNNCYNTFGSSIFSDSDSGCAIEEYLWAPTGLTPDQIRRFFSVIPEDKIPYPKSEGERYRAKQLTYQLPPQDCEPRFCRALTENEVQELLAFKLKRKAESLGRGVVRELGEGFNENLSCDKCGEQLQPYQLAVFASRAGNNRAWHPQCFTCSECSNLLVDLIYFYYHEIGSLCCGRHHAERYKPRCGACDELIFSDECTEAEGYTWHLDHFVCFSCEQPLASQRYLLQAQRPYCMRCYHETQTETCVSCQQRIVADEPCVSQNGLFWHESASCYACTFCGKPMNHLECPPIVVGLELFCSTVCQTESAESELNKENLEALLASSIASPFEQPVGLDRIGLQPVDGGAVSFNADLLDPHSESFCSHNLPPHRQCPYHPTIPAYTSEPSQDLVETAASGSVRGRPPVMSTVTSQDSIPEALPTRRVHFPRSVSFPAEIDAQGDDEGKRCRPRRSRRRGRHHRRHHANNDDDTCSTCSSSSSDSVDGQGFSLTAGRLDNEILMSSSATGFANGDVLSISSSTGSAGNYYPHAARGGLYAGKRTVSGRKKRHGSKNCLVS